MPLSKAPTPPPPQVDKKSPGNMAKRGGRLGRIGGGVGRGAHIAEDSISSLLFLILWTIIELVFELKKVK